MSANVGGWEFDSLGDAVCGKPLQVATKPPAWQTWKLDSIWRHTLSAFVGQFSSVTLKLMEGFLDCGNSSINVWYLVFAPDVQFPVSDTTRINTHISSNISSNYSVLKGSDAANSFCTNSLHLKWWDRWWHPMFSSSTEANSSSNRNHLQISTE
jgi:hypothetical protein